MTNADALLDSPAEEEDDRLAPPPAPARDRRPMWLGSMLLHLAMIGLIVLETLHHHLPPEPLPPPGVAVVFEAGTPGGPSASTGSRRAVPGAPPPIPQPSAAPEPAPAASAPLAALLHPEVRLTPPPPEPPDLPEVEALAEPLPAVEPVPAEPAPATRPSRPQQLAFAAPVMDLSGLQAALRHAAPRARPSAPHRGLDFSLGSVIREGAIAEPFARGDARALGADWRNALRAWLEAHKYYPDEAARRGEQGDSEVRVMVDRTGRVQQLELVSSSGSQWLDLATQSLFRDARLPPFPPNTVEATYTFNLTVHYMLIHR